MRPVRLLCLTLAACAMAAPAAAQFGPPSPDLDRDGKVTLVEYKKSQADQLFGRFDKDRDGNLLRAEIDALASMAKRFGGARAAQRVNSVWKADANGDGVISRPELEGRSAQRFKAGDANRDGVLDRAELKALNAQIESET